MKHNLPYFVTWSAQAQAIQIEVKKTLSDHYILEDNRELYDLSSCSYHLSFGLRNKEIQDVIREQLDELPVLGPKFSFDLKRDASLQLLESLGLNGKIFYTTSGSETVENALKMVRDITKKDLVLRRKNSYHGATLGSLSVTGDWRSENVTTLSDLSLTIPEPHEEDAIKKTEILIKENLDKGIAAIILETITGGNGVIIPPKTWYQSIQELCHKYDIKLILDEVVCGFYRTGKNFGFHHYPFLKPDFICLSKAITGGFIPFGALYCSPKISEFYDSNKLKCGLTNYAHPLGLRAMMEILNIINQEEFKDLVTKRTETLSSFLEEAKALPLVKEVRQIGLLAAVELKSNSLNQAELISHGIYVNIIGNNIILAPFLNTPQENLRLALNKLNNFLKLK